MSTNYVVIDLETYGHKTYKRFCNPLDPEHYIVAVAYKFKGQEAQVDYNYDGISPDDAFKNIDLSTVDVIIAHNAKFDLLYLWPSKILQDWLRCGGRIWCTLQAEYLLRGQQGVVHGGRGADSLSLDALSVKYGGTLKDEEVKDVWSNGGTVLDIPKDQLIEYAVYDVINTEIVLVAQIKKATKLGMIPIITTYNEHLLAVTEMEFNGMYFNKEKAKVYAAKLERKLEKLSRDLVSLLVDNELWPQQMVDFNIKSYRHMGNLFFGGSLKVKQKAPLLGKDGQQVRFKSGPREGELRTRNEVVEVLIPGLNEPFRNEWTTDKGGRGTGEDVLLALKEIATNDLTPDVINLLLKYRTHAKILSTYLYKRKPDGESGLVPLAHIDDCLHSEYETTYTETGRLSSRNPNLQNVPPFVTELFESRYGPKGSIVELDFSQLEIVVQAYITQCPQMLQDIEDGVDFHCLRLSYAEDRPYEEVYDLCQTDADWKLKRKAAKIISFQKAYGAHPSKIANEVGLPEATVTGIFDKESERYPEINAYYDGMTDYLDSNHEYTDRPLDVRVNGVYETNYKMKQITGKYQTLTGKRYTFYKKAVQTKRGVFEYWPGPNIMNYPIQGTAADIVSMQTGRVFRYMLNQRDKGLMVNEIHDSNVLDVKNEYVEEITAEVKRILEDVETSFKTLFGLKFNAPIKVDSGHGVNWREAK